MAAAMQKQLTRLAAPFAAMFFAGLASLLAAPAQAVPAYASQTGQNCNACHVGGFGPQLTPFGRRFKDGGYTLRTNTFNVPLSVMAVASYVRTRKAQDPPPTPDFSSNDNLALDQISVFLAGGWGQHLGAFVQTTYDGIGKRFTWDNLDLRATTKVTLAGHGVQLGASLNNSPTITDPFNTLKAWGYPYTSSSLAPSPGAQPIIGSFAQTTLGLTGYAVLDSGLRLEAGGYQTPGGSLLRRLGSDPTSPGILARTAPYARIAYEKDLGDSNFEVGVFGLWANLYPGGDRSAGTSDRYADTGVDASYQWFRSNKDVFTLNGRFTHESRTQTASQALGLAQFGPGRLDDLRLDASYFWRNKIGATVGLFDTTGTSDNLIYGGNRTFKPDSSGATFQVDGTPWGAGDSGLGRRFNARLGVQYTVYGKFDGARNDYDGAGHNASDNNTLRLFAWFAY